MGDLVDKPPQTLREADVKIAKKSVLPLEWLSINDTPSGKVRGTNSWYVEELRFFHLKLV